MGSEFPQFQVQGHPLFSTITGVSPTDGSPSNLPLGRLQSSGDCWTQLTPCVPKVRVTRPFSVSEQRLDTQDNFFVKPAGPDCLRSVGVALGRRVQSQCSLLVFPRQVGGGSESRDPPHASTRRWSVESWRARASDNPLGMEGSEYLLLSGLCRLRASSPPRKHCHVRVCGLCVHTRTITCHAQCQALHSFIHSFIRSFKCRTQARTERARAVRHETQHSTCAAVSVKTSGLVRTAPFFSPPSSLRDGGWGCLPFSSVSSSTSSPTSPCFSPCFSPCLY